MITNKLVKKNVVLLLILIVLFVFLIPSQKVYAQTKTTVYDLEKSSVMDDLSTFIIDGKAFDIKDYPINPDGKLEVLTFVEYCFSSDEANINDYELYIYLYNPSLISFDTSHILNKIQIAVSFNDLDYAQEYQKFFLKFCSKSSDGLFYKYKVNDPDNVILHMAQDFSNTHAGKRQYYVSGVELVQSGHYNATEYNVAMNYQYSGFAEGYGDSEKFPLSMTSAGIETLQTDVNYTWWRPEGETEGGNNIQSQLNSVYFSVPNELLEKYGVLQAVSMEWYEYFTKWVMICDNTEVYNHLLSYIGKTITAYDSSAKYEIDINPHSHTLIDGTVVWDSDFVYNKILDTIDMGCEKTLNSIFYLFESDTDKGTDYILPAEELLKYIQNYKGSGEKINGKYYSELFEDFVDEGRQIGYNQVDVKAEDKFSLTSYNLSQSFWQKLFGIADYEKEEFDNIKGIEQINSADFTLSDSSFGAKYFVNNEDASKIKEYCVSSQLKDRTVFLLRYSITDYESFSCKFREPWGSSGTSRVDNDSYAFRETVFLDLDVIDVTFYKDGVSTVIPVVSNPIDGIADGTPPVEDPEDFWDWLKKVLSIILGFVLLVMLICLLWPILPYLIKGVAWIITLPFRAIKAIIKALKKKE